MEDRMSMPALGAPAPDFCANSTAGPLCLADFRDRWLLLFSHPGDFTPVCTTEFLAFEQAADEFARRNCALLGLSIDSNASHLAWLTEIWRRTGVRISFPILDDRGEKVARAYGMISDPLSSTATVRTVFLIDPNGILRLMVAYPMTTGRNIVELLRALDALQTFDRTGEMTPANWQVGMALVTPPPQTFDQVAKRLEQPGKLCCMDWFLCLTDPNGT